MPMPPYDPYRLLYRHMIGISALMQRAVWEDVGGYDPAFTGYEDWDFWLGALERGWRGHLIERVTVEYRRHPETTNVRARRAYRDHFRALRTKHAGLYARRRELARESALPGIQRAVHRAYWGPRPVPAGLEQRAYGLLFGRRRPRG
jgi:GT2 family glycosyltransferase